MTKPAGTVTAIIARYGVVDHDGDLIERGAVPDGSRAVISPFGHSSIIDAQIPVGAGRLKSVADTLVFEGRLLLEDSANARATFAIIREMGDAMEWSFGYRIRKRRAPTSAESELGALQVLVSLDAFEVSPVIRGAGVGTRTVEAKRVEQQQTAQREKLEAIARGHINRMDHLNRMSLL